MYVNMHTQHTHTYTSMCIHVYTHHMHTWRHVHYTCRHIPKRKKKCVACVMYVVCMASMVGVACVPSKLLTVGCLRQVSEKMP